MLSRPKHKRRRLMAEINVVPYIDVMLVLLVIFMVTAPLLTQGVKVELPQTNAAALADQERETLVVTVDRRGQLFLDDRAIAPGALANKVAAILRLRPETPIYVRGDRNVAYNEVVRTMALLQTAGAKQIGLVTQAADDPKSP